MARARVVLQYDENGERVHTVVCGDAWTSNGPWLHITPDDNDGVQEAWPIQHVICVEWR